MNGSRIGLIKTLRARGVVPSQMVTMLQIRRALRDCKSVLDVGCGSNSPLALFGFERLVGLEGYLPSVEEARQRRTHHELVHGDVRELDRLFAPGSFDACVALDVIEHLPKADGLAFMNSMERVAAKKVLFLTPNGFLPQRHAEKSDLQEHLSGWDAQEMTGYGYAVQGVLGPKPLRGEYHRLKRKPEALWGLVSLAGHFCHTRWAPSKAAAILCVKTK